MTLRPLCRPIALASVLSLAGCQAFWDGAAPTPSHKVQLPASAALPQGARLVADYGAFQLAEVDDAALSALSARTDVEPRDDYDQILLNAGVLHTRLSTEAAPTGRGLHLVQFKGPIRPEWRAALDAPGVRVVGYVPSNSYLVYGDASALAGLDAASGVQFKGAYLARYKLQPTLKRQGPEGVAIQLVDDAPANETTLALIRQSASQEPRVQTALGFLNVVAKVAPDRVPAIAQQPDVVSIHARPRFKLLDERQDMILAGQLTGNAPSGPGYLAWLTAKGFTQAQFDASGFGVDVTDSPLDNGTTTPNHFGLRALGDITGASRVLYVRLEGTANPGSNIKGCDGHGNLNAHVIGGWDDHSGAFPFRDAAGFRYGLGVAPFVRLGNSAIFDPVDFTSPDYETLISHAYRDAMRISSNSWGGQGDYDNNYEAHGCLLILHGWHVRHIGVRLISSCG